jgi:hypothetical protein
MAKNLSRKFATMSEEERLRFAQEESEGTDDRPTELDFEEPRDGDHMGPHFGSLKEEVSDPEHRDGLAALLDDEAHERALQKQARNRQADQPRSDESPSE